MLRSGAEGLRAGRAWWTAGFVALAVALTSVTVSVALIPPAGSQSSSAAAAGSARATTAEPVLGVLGVSGDDYASEAAAGVRSVTVAASWTSSEPTQGSFSASYATQLRQRIAAARTAGFSVVLDPGLQYAPTWAVGLPGGTQFVDQYGDVFTGAMASGNHVVNAYTDAAVRSAEATYLAWLGTQITPGTLLAVRQGGGPLGELRYPGPDYAGHTNCYWAYDASSQATSSVAGWTPGTGTPTEAATFLTAYDQAIDGYGAWLNGQLATDFSTIELVMLPGWGQRPGGVAQETAALLTLGMDEFNEGLDWTDLLGALPDPASSVAYTTYLDARSVKATPQLEDPADYLSSLVSGTSLRLGGENTGNGDLADMTLTLQRAEDLDMFIVDWMDESQLAASAAGTDPGGPTFAELGAEATSIFGGDGGGGSGGGSGSEPGGPSPSNPGGTEPGVPLPAPVAGIAADPVGSGYWLVDEAGDVAAFGAATSHGSLAGHPLDAPIVHIVATSDGAGYWLVASDGGIFAFGDARFYGSMGGHALNAPVIDLAPTTDGRGYRLVATDGGIFTFGDATYLGSMGGVALNRPVVAMATDPTTDGYWMVASDGGVFAFGAPFLGSTGDQVLNRPITGMAVSGSGYRFVASDGGVFAFGVPFAGSTGGMALAAPIVGLADDPSGGYWLAASDGGVFAFGAPFFGSA